MRVLIDTSAWIEFFRPNGDVAIKSRIAELIGVGQAAYTCPVSFELMAGARPSELADLREGLGFAQRLVVGPEHWDAAAQSASKLRSKGETVPASDLLIATVAVTSGVGLIARDKHFATIRTHALPKLQLA